MGLVCNGLHFDRWNGVFHVSNVINANTYFYVLYSCDFKQKQETCYMEICGQHGDLCNVYCDSFVHFKESYTNKNFIRIKMKAYVVEKNENNEFISLFSFFRFI